MCKNDLDNFIYHKKRVLNVKDFEVSKEVSLSKSVVIPKRKFKVFPYNFEVVYFKY